MLIYDDEYNRRLNKAWQKFIQNQPYDYSFIRPEILDSWKRSRSYLVDPYHSKTTILHPDDLQKRIENNRLLIDVTRPYMEKLYDVVKGSGFYLLLVDKDGFILDLIGDEDIVEQGRKHSMLVVGANRSEQYAGTNAIGTGLVLKKPFQMWGEEHYIKVHKDFSCSSAPIIDTEENLLGCLNITGRSTECHIHTLGMIMSAVDGITNELRLRKAYSEIEKVSNQRNLIIETMPSGVILLNRDNEIIQINSTAITMFGLANMNVTGKNFFNIIKFDETNSNDTQILENEIYNKETNIYLPNNVTVPRKYNVSVNFVIDSNGQRDGTVLRFNEQKRINKLVNRISGFKSKFTFDSIIGSSPQMKAMLHTCEKAAHSTSNILILGESGTGKELIAQSIHNASDYASGPFVAINCGALPKGLVESELFGYESGAFTGANKEGNPGKFELADGGTLLLDEIGEMPLDVQVTLLRVLENKEIVRIGGKYPKPINVRVIAATNRDLKKAIENKTFRDDLYYRLNVFTIEVPPLRDRGNDIIELTDHFIKSFSASKNINITVDPGVYPLLLKYSWPGNIRELENTIERAVNIIDDGIIRPEHLPDYILNAVNYEEERIDVEKLHNSPVFNLETAEYNLIISSLRKSDGNVKKAAELLGISRRTIYRKMEKYNINYSDFREQ